MHLLYTYDIFTVHIPRLAKHLPSIDPTFTKHLYTLAGPALAGFALAGFALAGFGAAGGALTGFTLAGFALAGSALARSALAGFALVALRMCYILTTDSQYIYHRDTVHH